MKQEKAIPYVHAPLQRSAKDVIVEQRSGVEVQQYSLPKVLLVWVAAAAPMGLLGWIVAPALSRGSANPGIVRVGMLTVGLIWQFALVMILLAQEGTSWRWSDIRRRLWLVQPSSEESGRTDRRMWWWLFPLVILTVAFEMQLTGVVEHVWTSLIPAFAEPASFSFGGFLSSPEVRARLVGAWDFYALFVVSAFFNTVAGEELLWRGLLLPRMKGAFGRWDWVANGLLFGFYHWHQPWGAIGSAIDGALLFAFPSRRFKSAWFGIIAHSLQSLFFAFLLLGLVLGLA